MSVEDARQRLAGHVEAVALERQFQLDKWGEQSLEFLRGAEDIGTQHNFNIQLAAYQAINDEAGGGYDWFTVLMEEVYEAFVETDPANQREELLQVAAVALAIVNDIDKKEEGK